MNLKEFILSFIEAAGNGNNIYLDFEPITTDQIPESGYLGIYIGGTPDWEQFDPGGICIDIRTEETKGFKLF